MRDHHVLILKAIVAAVVVFIFMLVLAGVGTLIGTTFAGQNIDTFLRMAQVAAAAVGVVALLVAALASFAVQSRGHLLDAYHKVFELLDTADMRAARHFVNTLKTAGSARPVAGFQV